MNYKKIEIENLPTFIIGDIHGDITSLHRGINDNKLRDCNLIIAGDIGLGFSKEVTHIMDYSSLNEWLLDKNIFLYLIRGNHDDPSYFNCDTLDDTNVMTLQDYSVLSVKDTDTNILCVGGALSIDRTYRQKRRNQAIDYYTRMCEGVMNDEEILSLVGKNYWEDEMPIYDEEALNQINNDGIKLTYIITHTAPSFCFKCDNKGIEYWLLVDKDLERDLKIEREALSNIYNKVIDDGHPIKEWIYGHFHEHNEEDINNIHFTTLFNADYKFDIKEIKIN